MERMEGCIFTNDCQLTYKHEMTNSQIIIYQSENGETKLDVRLEDATCKHFLQVQTDINIITTLKT